MLIEWSNRCRERKHDNITYPCPACLHEMWDAAFTAGRTLGIADGLKTAWDAVNAEIVPGNLDGNGSDKTAERNGLIWATNVIMTLRDTLRRGA